MTLVINSSSFFLKCLFIVYLISFFVNSIDSRANSTSRRGSSKSLAAWIEGMYESKRRTNLKFKIIIENNFFDLLFERNQNWRNL